MHNMCLGMCEEKDSLCSMHTFNNFDGGTDFSRRILQATIVTGTILSTQ